MRRERDSARALTACLGGLAVALAGCGGFGGGGGSPSSSSTGSSSTGQQTTTATPSSGSGTTTSAATVSYDHDVAPILKANCTSCHAAGGVEAQTPLDSYAAVMAGKSLLGYTPSAFVVAGQPSESLLITKITGTSQGPMMPETAPLSSADIQTIMAWIQQGAVQDVTTTGTGGSGTGGTGGSGTGGTGTTGAGKPTQLLYVTGNNQSGITGAAINPFVAEVEDAQGNPVSGVTVTFSVSPSDGGTLSANTAVTGANGQATTTLTFGSNGETVNVTASVTGLTPYTFVAQASSPLQKRSYDADIAPILALHCTACHGPGGSEQGTPLDSYTHVVDGTTTMKYTPAAFISAGNPSASLIYLKVTAPGSNEGGLMPPNQPLSASDIAIIQAWISQGAVQSLSGPAASMAVSGGNNQSGPAGSQLTTPLQVVVKDSNNQGVAGVLVTFAATGGTVSPLTGTTDGGGHAQTTLTLGDTVGPVSVTATAAGFSASFTETANVSTFSGGALAGSTNAMDVAALTAMRAANVEPAPLSTDEEFLRRVTADVVGRLPTQSELSSFLNDTSPDKRATVIDGLFNTPLPSNPAVTEYANHWAKDILAPWACVGTNATAFNAALVADVQADMPISQLVTMFVTGQGVEGLSYTTQFPGNGYNDLVDQCMLTFTGMTSECARCHDHHLTVAGQDDPMWVQNDNYGMYALLTTTTYNATELTVSGSTMGKPIDPNWVADGYANKINAGDTIPSYTWVDSTGATQTSTTLPHLFVNYPTNTGALTPQAQRAAAFASILVNSKVFMRGTGHRIFSELLDPLLDPNQFLAANILAVQQPAVLQACEDRFRANGTSLKNFIREILNSNLYQLTTVGTTTANDKILARRTVRRHHGEVVDQGTSETAGVPYTANGFVLQTFGYPSGRVTIIDRSDAVNLGQPLVLLNSTSSINGRMGSTSQIQSLANMVTAKTDPITMDEAITTIYECALSRDPSPTELAAVEAAIVMPGVTTYTATQRAEQLQDVAVGICSSVEFVSR